MLVEIALPQDPRAVCFLSFEVMLFVVNRRKG